MNDILWRQRFTTGDTFNLVCNQRVIHCPVLAYFSNVIRAYIPVFWISGFDPLVGMENHDVVPSVAVERLVPNKGFDLQPHRLYQRTLHVRHSVQGRTLYEPSPLGKGRRWGP